LSAKEVRQLIGGVSNATLYRMLANHEFPRPVAVTAVWAIDIDPMLSEIARHRLVENGIANCSVITGDAYDIARLAGPADFVFMANAFHGVPDRARLAKAVGAALKSNGQFAIVNWHKRPRDETRILGEPRGPKTELRMSPEETTKSVEAGGLKFSKMVEMPPYHYAVIFEHAGA
jgi:protein-L-isoaspartate O-methyltransferase